MKEYFSHDLHSRNDRKMVKLFKDLGVAGIGIYWCIVEMLHEERGYISVSEIENIAYELRKSANVIEKVIKGFELFSFDSEKFWSESALLRIEKKEEKSIKARESIGSRWHKHTNVLHSYSDENTNKVKESKVNESKVNNRANALVFPNEKTQKSNREFSLEYQRLLLSLAGKEMKEVWIGIKTFIADNKPDIPDPYIDAWNLFVQAYKLPRVDLVTTVRRKKVRTRVNEEGFNFYKILEKIKTSDHLLGKTSDWKVNFDWVFENESNYAKILEGNYGQ